MKDKPTIKTPQTPIPAASPLPNFAFVCIPSLRGCSSLRPLHLGIRLPHSVSCILSSTHTSYPALLAACALVSYPLCSFIFFLFRANSCPFVVHSFLSALLATSQLCKTNPIPSTPESPQPLLPQRLTKEIALAPPEKTNPIKPNFITPKPQANPYLPGPTYRRR